MKKSSYLIVLLFLMLNLLIPEFAEAQCAMCKAAAESNLKDGGLDGKGLNNGILYMLSMPYVFVSVLGFIWWRNRKKEKDIDQVLHAK